ncbi:hypothetical protein PV396_42785 [Streptomyces sp. ME02-8801-2C]|uniref:hypothetical protein n=1 Tax=Streptomyces sp. ME02-8801-2C TaxID=3028680 RepID=UPI0029A47B2A|nr:hypothetical protein [Streptomyces sp. ME02-8801-2C]MDX3458584.1 hypothetical protein [Streptomyces sp. ME02-8801-2C]
MAGRRRRPCGDWAYEVRAIRERKALVPEVDPVVLDAGSWKLHEVFRYITDKR